MKIRSLTNSEIAAYFCGLIVGAAGYASGQYYYEYKHSHEPTDAESYLLHLETAQMTFCLSQPSNMRPPVCTDLLNKFAQK
ncbi:TPA: hypothetical protein ACK3Q6_004475 [Burkholderia cepacia]